MPAPDDDERRGRGGDRPRRPAPRTGSGGARGGRGGPPAAGDRGRGAEPRGAAPRGGDGGPRRAQGGAPRRQGEGGGTRRDGGPRRDGQGGGRPHADAGRRRDGEQSRGGSRADAGRRRDGEQSRGGPRADAGRRRDGQGGGATRQGGSASRASAGGTGRRSTGESRSGASRASREQPRRDKPRSDQSRRGQSRSDQPRRDQPRRGEPRRDEARAPRSWGSLARKSIRELGPTDSPGGARQAWREAVSRARGDEPWEPEVWIEEPDRPAKRPPAPRAKTSRPTAPSSARRRTLPRDVVDEVGKAVPTPRADRYRERLAEAAKAYERDRYRDAAALLKPLAETMPSASAVRELYGLTMYRLGRWDNAIRELEAYRDLERGSYDQHPTLADCYRARKRWAKVAELWEELREASPSADLVAEGRIVMAGALSDQSRLADAIALLEKTRTDMKRPRPHHLRIWYALADLYERAGEIPRARELFRRVFNADPELYDTGDRLRAIG